MIWLDRRSEPQCDWLRNQVGEETITHINGGRVDPYYLAPKLLWFQQQEPSLYQQTHQVLQANGYAGSIVTLNGTNNDPDALHIYRNWLQRHAGQDVLTGSQSVDIRAALVEEFRERAAIMIATESGAEGINLQFCSLVVNG